MTVLLTVLFKIQIQESSIHTGCSLICDSGLSAQARVGWSLENWVR